MTGDMAKVVGLVIRTQLPRGEHLRFIVQAYRHTRPPSAASAASAVDVGVFITGRLRLNDQVHLRYVQTSAYINNSLRNYDSTSQRHLSQSDTESDPREMLPKSNLAASVSLGVA